MKKLLIVFHSKTGGAYQMAQAAAKGAGSEPEVDVNFVHAAKAGAQELLDSDGYIFATPENLAMMSGMMKDSSTEPTIRFWTTAITKMCINSGESNRAE